MTRQERPSDEELQDGDSWDFESAQELPRERAARAVVSVAFAAEEFGVVSEAARGAGMKVSRFIRQAALERAATHGVVSPFGPKAIETQGRWAPTINGSEQGAVSSAPTLLPA
jgi:hypothetical protein